MLLAHSAAAQIALQETLKVKRRDVVQRHRQVAFVHRINRFIEASDDVVLVLSQDAKAVVHLLQLDLREVREIHVAVAPARKLGSRLDQARHA